MTESPPGERSRGPQDPGTDNLTNESTLNQPVEVPHDRPWARRPDGPEVEVSYQRDKRQWQRRISCARRTSHDGADDVAPYGGHWTHWSTPATGRQP